VPGGYTVEYVDDLVLRNVTVNGAPIQAPAMAGVGG
jgi:hypothetical protein